MCSEEIFVERGVGWNGSSLQVGVKYNSDHTEGKSIPLCNGALTFGEEFFIYTQSSQFGDPARYYRLEGSSLDKISEK